MTSGFKARGMGGGALSAIVLLPAGGSAVMAAAARRGLALAPAALVVLAVIGLSACSVTSAGATHTYRAHGVSFDHPAGWQQGAVRTNIAAGSVHRKLWNTAFGIKQTSYIDVGAYRLNPPSFQISLGPVPPAVRTSFRQLFKSFGGVLHAGPEVVMIGGMPSYLARGTGTDQGIHVKDTYVFDINGATEYVLICEHGLDHAAEVVRACDQMIRTFKASN